MLHEEMKRIFSLTGNYYEKDGQVKGPTDHRLASNSYPVKTLQREDDTPGFSELDYSLVSWGEYLLFRPATNIRRSTF